MSTVANLPKQLTLAQLQAQWPAILNPVIANLLVNGQLITNIAFNSSGNTVVNHKLGRTPQGWMLSAPKGAAIIYEASYQPTPDLTLTLVSNATITSDLWVF